MRVITRRLFGGRERMQRAELGPRHRNHLGGRVEFHRARAERNHRAVERQVAVGQAAQIPEHFRFRAVAVEDRVREKGRRPGERGRQRVVHFRVEIGDGEWRVVGVEGLPDMLDVLARRRLVQCDAERRLVDAAEIEAMRDAVVDDALRAGAGRHGDRVEVNARRHGEAEPLEAGLEDGGEPMHAPRDRRQALRPVIHRVHARDDREQHLRRADVRGRLLAANVLFARLQREPVRGVAVRVDGDADQPARQRTLEFVARREVCRMRTAVAHRHAESLRRTDHRVGAPFARRREQRQREDIGGHDDLRVLRVERRGELAVIAHVARRTRILQQHGE